MVNGSDMLQSVGCTDSCPRSALVAPGAARRAGVRRDPVGHRFPLYNRAFMQHRQQEREFGVSPWLTHVRFVSAVALNPERAAGDRGLPMPVGATKPAAGSKQNHRPVRGKLPINSLQCSTMTDDRATRERAAERRMVVDAY